MHVLILPSWYPETPEDINGIFFRQQAQALHRQGLRVGVAAPIFRSLRGEPETLFSTNYGMRHYVDQGIPTYTYRSMLFFPYIPHVDSKRWIHAGKKLFRRYVAEHGRPDILHAHSMNYGGVLAQQIHAETGIPYVITEHSSTYARKLIRSWQRPAMMKSARQCASRIAVSHNFCALLEQEFEGLPWKYIPNILSTKFETSSTATKQTPDQNFTFCSVANLNHNKGFDILLPAFAEAVKIHPSLKLKIGGAGPKEEELIQTASRLGLGNSIEFLGALSNDAVLQLMQESHAFVLASRVETFGVVYIEALSQGLPVVATRCGGPESIVTQENGLLVPTENISALSEALIKLYENHQQYQPERLREACLNEFGEQAVTTRLIQEYQKALT